MAKLNLNSLVEYIDHLEQYRQLQRDKISHFQTFYYSLLKEDDGGYNYDQKHKNKLNIQTINQLVADIESKLETCQLKRMLNNNEITMMMSHHQMMDNNLRNETNEQAEQKEFKNDNNDAFVGGGDVQQSSIDVSDKDCVVSQGSNKFVDTNYEKQQTQVIEQNINNNIFEDNITITTVGGGTDKNLDNLDQDHHSNEALLHIRNNLIDELQAKFHKLESIIIKQEPSSSTKIAPADDVVVQRKQKQQYQLPPPSIMSLPSSSVVNDLNNKKVQLTQASNKIMINGFELPLPGHFNVLPESVQNVIICSLPEHVRGQYLNICWECRYIQDQLLIKKQQQLQTSTITSMN